VSSRNKARSRFLAFFFHGRSATPLLANPPPQDLALEQLAFTTGDGVHIQPITLRRSLLASVAALQALQAGVKSPLLFVQQTIKQRLGRLQVIARLLLGLPCGPLLLPTRPIQRTVEITAFPLPPEKAPGLHQLAQGILGRDVNHRLQFGHLITGHRTGHQRLRRIQQRTMPRKMDVTVGPQSQLIVVRDRIQRVIGAAMGIAAAVTQGGELAQDRIGDGAAQGTFELRHGGDFLVVQEAHQFLGRIVDDIHNVNITPNVDLSSVVFTFRTGSASPWQRLHLPCVY